MAYKAHATCEAIATYNNTFLHIKAVQPEKSIILRLTAGSKAAGTKAAAAHIQDLGLQARHKTLAWDDQAPFNQQGPNLVHAPALSAPVPAASA